MTGPVNAASVFTAARIVARRQNPEATDDEIGAAAGIMLAQLAVSLANLCHERWAWSMRTGFGFHAQMQTDVFADPLDADNRHPLSTARDDVEQMIRSLGLPHVNI